MMEFQSLPPRMLSQQRAAGIKPVFSNDGSAKCLDPLTGKFITVEEFNSKYDNGKALLQVYIQNDDGTETIETMTAADYIQKYSKVANPPKATIASPSDDDDEVKHIAGGTYKALKGMGLSDSEIEEYFDKPDSSDTNIAKRILYTLKADIVIDGKEIKSVDELVKALKEAKLKNLLYATGAGNIAPSDTTSKCLDPLTGKFITIEEFNSKYDNGKTLLRVLIPKGNGMAKLETMTAADYIQLYGKVANPPKAFLA